ncbi:DUF6541 family protein [Brachybacterium sacelli]|uniref:Uncharacterized protein n=1 Tax=Brachybacterium sacelli TaxID=173364 RepID=A0ABS4X4Z3_9MICO|nr:DUF6541 family protein [Brachybacterium sacelli]MBP2383532.1 hypothetical protein [Brachybacterium sacelli]
MTALAALVLAILVVLAAAYLPGYAAVRMLGGSHLLSLALGPALAAAIAGISAILAALVGIPWSLLPFLLGAALLVAVAYGLRRLGVSLPSTVLDGPLSPRRAVPGGAAWIGGAVAIAIAPIAVQAGRPDAVLERWDTLYHLSALQRIRETGIASSLQVGAVSNTEGDPTFYPAAFHALAALVPGVPTATLLNATVLALAVTPWILGIALLARTLFAEVPWAPFAAAVTAAVIPATPLDLWIHLSPVPNLSAFAALPGALAAASALWTALLPGTTARPAIAAVLVIGSAGAGLGLTHPNVAVTALILLAVLTAVTALPWWRRRPALIAVPVLALLPVALLSYTPLGSDVTGFNGGLEVSWWLALGEVLLGLHTVWPMALGVVIAVLWWPGLVASFRSAPQRWAAVAWLVIAVIYLDAALDSPLNLSALYYRGQDRVSMPLAMLSAVLVVPGLQVWARLLGRRREDRPSRRGPSAVTAVLVVAAVLATLASIPARTDNAAKNLAADYPGRGRFLQADERALFEQHVPQMDPDGTVLASPFSGAAHLYALFGQDVRLPVAGMAYTDLDRDLIYATENAATNPADCRLLEENGIAYVYQELMPYNRHKTSDSVNFAGADLGTVLFETGHSRMIEIDCDPGDGSYDPA